MLYNTDESLTHKAETIINGNVKNLELISYFCKSTSKTPVFLSVIQRNYPEIKPLIKEGLIVDSEPIKSYIFNLDKFENYFYEKYQEKIDYLKDQILFRKRKKDELIDITESMEPEKDCEDYEQKMREVLVFARKSIDDLDKMEMEKEDFNHIVGELQKEMMKDFLYKFLFYIRNDEDIIFNKRTEDNESVIHTKILNYLNDCDKGNGWKMFTSLKKKGFFKEFSPAKNYYISDLGLCVDLKIKEIKWSQDDENYQKTEDEIAQEKEFNDLIEKFFL